jgi:hypothetical protein
VVAVRGKESGGWSSAWLKIRHTARRRSLEDEGSHTRNGGDGDTQARLVDLMDWPNPYGLR